MTRKSCFAMSLAATLVIGMSLQLAGCASTTPELDSRFGEAVRGTRDAQALKPAAPVSKDPVLGVDGKAAVQAQERYEESFKSPPKTFEVIGIGGTLGGQ